MKKFAPYVFLFFIYVLLTSYNLDKAYHIDDAAYLEIAEWISENPMRPMTGLVNWGNNAEPIHYLNQPPLYFYLLAGWGKIFGYAEPAMHLLQSLFSLAALCFFFQICRIIVPRLALILTTFLCLGPAFFVGQNLMVDIPVLSLWLAFYYLLLIPEVKNEHARYFGAAVVASLAVLMKYSSLPLLPILVIHLLLRKKYRCLYAAFVPVMALCLWSFFNYFEYGSLHILDRPTGQISIANIFEKAISWTATLGAISPFSIFFLQILKEPCRKANKVLKKVFIFANFSVLLLIVVFYINEKFSLEIYKLQKQADFYLALFFVFNGLFLIFSITYLLLKKHPEILSKGFYKNLINNFDAFSSDFILLYWLLSGTFFMVFFAPFMATRHVLPVMPAVLLLLGSGIRDVKPDRFVYISVVATLFLTANLAVSDWQFADFYRKQAKQIVQSLPSGGKIWFTGHWGWQWYARQAGMNQLESLAPEAEPGDYLVYPKLIHQQRIHPALELEQIRKIEAPPMRFTCFSTADNGRFYFSKYLPWSLSRKPLGDILVFRVVQNRFLK